jgi:hypothetical protein
VTDDLTPSSAARLGDLAERLDAIVDELDELAFDALREAVADGASGRPASDRAVTRARRSIEKASALLRDLSGR